MLPLDRRIRLWTLPAALVLVCAVQPHFCMGCNFEGSQLAGADFGNGVYTAANFERAQLERASFRDARLVAANFQSADLTGAAFDGAQCVACNFADAKLDHATFSGVQIVAANFQGFAAAVSDADLRDLLSGCMTCNFASASLAGRDLSGIAIIGVDFSKADLRNSRFDGATLCWYVVNGSQRTATCDKFGGALVAGASFSGVLICTDPTQKTTCSPVSADALRRDTGSPLTGAAIP
jgi:uncharacterized protein YjbI with pentapeptide repeats